MLAAGFHLRPRVALGGGCQVVSGARLRRHWYSGGGAWAARSAPASSQPDQQSRPDLQGSPQTPEHSQSQFLLQAPAQRSYWAIEAWLCSSSE